MTYQTSSVASRADAPSRSSSETLVQSLVQAMREDIVHCVLQPGERMRFEYLRKRYTSSIGTLREALSVLVGDGLVNLEGGRGFSVAPVSREDLLDIVEMRVDLETRALRESIRDGDDAWEGRVLTAFHLLSKVEQSTALRPKLPQPVWNSRHRDFHEALVSACRSPRVMQFRRMLFDQAHRYRRLNMAFRQAPKQVGEHKLLMQATLERDAKSACLHMESHIRSTARNIIACVPGFGSNAKL
jgi:GntR family carbon starvation induced transcriptional regulator